MGEQRRRARSPHPGVRVLRRTLRGRARWAARWRDPVSGRPHEVLFEKLGLRSHEARRAWAIRKAEALAEERRRLTATGAAALEEWTVRDAVRDYLDRAAERLEATTVEGYAATLWRFVEWAEGANVRTVQELRGPHLAAYRDWAIRLRRRSAVSGGRRGERTTARTRRAPKTVNHDLLRVRVFLHEARRLGRTPFLDRDVVTDNLASLRGVRERPDFLRPGELHDLLAATLRHDRDRFSITRREKAGEAPTGTTPRNEPVAALVLAVLLGGFRLGEARGLRWDYVHLGGEAPEVVLPAHAVKTRIARSVDLVVTPTLPRLLEALQLHRGEGAYVFGGEAPLAMDRVKAARRRLTVRYGAPDFTWQRLRQTCATFGTCAPGVFGAASAFLSAKRCGHSVQVAEDRYAGLVRDIPREARTLEAAMRIEDLAEEIVREARGVVEGDAQDAAEA